MRVFPLVFKLCFKPGLDLNALTEVGYDGVENYFNGRSRYNSTAVGWAGHHENGSIIGDVEGKDKGFFTFVPISLDLR